MAISVHREHTMEAFGVLGLVPASVELRAEASVPTRPLSRLLACLLFARSRALQPAHKVVKRESSGCPWLAQPARWPQPLVLYSMY